MQIEGLPQKFWVVVEPTAVSTLADICFQSSFSHFAGQVRGGLHEDQIAGIFAEEESAVELATSLLERRAPVDPSNIRIHHSPWPNWFATQDTVRGVRLHDKVSGQQVSFSPPAEWGRHWAWNVSEDGNGIVMVKTA